MSSEHLASAQNELKGNLGGAWNILDGAQGQYQDLGIARRFGGSSAAYSLRDIGAMNGRVVKARRDVDGQGSDPEEDFSANQVQSGALEDWVNGKLESTLPADSSQGLTVVVQHSLINSGTETTIKFYADSLTSGSPRFFSNNKTYKFYKGLSDNRYILQLTDSTNLIKASASDADKLPQDVTTYESVTGTLTSITVTSSSPAAAAYSLRKVDSSYSGDAVRIRRSSDDVEVDVAFDSDDKVSASSAITNVAEEGGESGSTTATDLNGFLNESVSGFTSVPYSGINASYKNFTSDPTISDTAFSGTNGGTQSRLVYLNTTDAFVTASDFDGCKVKVTGTVNTLSGGDLTVKPATSNDGGGSWTPPESNKVISDGTTGSFEYIFTGNGTNGFLSVLFLVDASTTVDVSNLTFEYIEHGATVYTWYDQAGSNDAVQDTATNQPKIAENGTLLADGLDFDGSNDFLQTSTQVLTGTETGANSMYVVFKQTSGDAGYICGSAGSQSGSDFVGQSLYGNNADSVFALSNGNNIDEPERDNITITQNSTVLVSANYSNNNTNTLNKNANNNGYANGTSAYDFNAGTKFTIGARDGSTATAVLLNGSIKEIIAYDSDQAANRFKIESNINNYYGLYNDANDMAEAFRATAGTLTNESKDGFDLAVGTPTAYVGFEFNEKIANGDSVFISFNLDLTGGSGGDATPIMRLTKTTLDGTDSSNFINPSDLSQGFNLFELTSSDNDAKFFAISEGNDDVNISISDFKVSRIARNGFVETWYDQSGNSRPLIQITATEQPSIVENGGFVGGVKANVATSDDTMQNLQVSTDGLTPNFGTDDWASGANSKLGLMYVGKINDSVNASTDSIIWGGGRGVSSYQGGGLSLQVIKGGNDAYKLMNERQGLTPSRTTVTITLNTDDDMILYGTADNRDFTLKLNSTTAAETESADLDTRENQALSLFGSYSGFNTRRYQNSSAGVCKECYLFAGDNISEVDTIATEINKHYNIYS